MIFDLYRLSIFEKQQLSLFTDSYDRSTLIAEILDERPRVELSETQSWFIGNVQSLEKNAFYFRIGKRSTRSRTTYADGKFLDSELEDYPNCIVFLDAKLGLVAIGHNHFVSANTTKTAKMFSRLLNESATNVSREAVIEITLIKDPAEFIQILRDAHRVMRFSFTIKRENHTDDEADFIGPYRNWISAIGGEEGKGTVKGRSLDADPLCKVTESISAIGGQASATVQEHVGDNPIVKVLKSPKVTISQDSVSDDSEKYDFLDRLRAKYADLRPSLTQSELSDPGSNES